MTPQRCQTLFLYLLSMFLSGTMAQDGSWNEWAAWTPCSVSCGAGMRKRVRACDLAPRMGAAWCPGKYLQTEPCNTTVPCPVDGGWGPWSPWSACSVSCGEGCMERYRSCSQPIPMYGGKSCVGDPMESQSCFAVRACPRDGGWSSWSIWSACTVTCGRGGSMHRYRSCNNPPPAEEGRPCEGDGHGIKDCTAAIKCPVNGQWSEWSPWSECSVSCGEGERMRRRACDRPPPQFGGLDCDREDAGELQIHSCTATLQHCPVDGGWTEWGDWGPCHSPNCLQTTTPSHSMRQRSCNSPLPSHGGLMCQGTFLQAGLCSSPLNCRVDGQWGEWSAWNCTRFVAARSRVCDNPSPSNGGRRCRGNDIQFHIKEEDPESYREACPQFPTDDEDMNEASGQGVPNFRSEEDND